MLQGKICGEGGFDPLSQVNAAGLYADEAGVCKIIVLFNKLAAQPVDGQLKLSSFQNDPFLLHEFYTATKITRRLYYT